MGRNLGIEGERRGLCFTVSIRACFGDGSATLHQEELKQSDPLFYLVTVSNGFLWPALWLPGFGSPDSLSSKLWDMLMNDLKSAEWPQYG
jgi:hypothetical protein